MVPGSASSVLPQPPSIMTTVPHSLAPASRRPFALAAFAAVLPLVPSALAADGSWGTTLLTGAANWTDTANWSGGTVADGVGAVATFSQDLTGALNLTLGAPTTVGTINLTDTGAGTDRGLTFVGGTLVFQRSVGDGTPTITASIGAGGLFDIPVQFNGANIQGTQGLVINGGTLANYSTTNAANRFNGGSGGSTRWSGFSGALTLNGGRWTTENLNVMPNNNEIVLSGGTELRAVFNNTRNQVLRGLSSSDAAAKASANDNASAEGVLTLGNNTTAGETYTFAGSVGGDIATQGAGQENSRLGITKTGSGTQKFTGANLYVGTTTINGGTLLVNGTHLADTSLSGNLAALATRGSYAVNSGGTLGGTGTIKPYDTAGGGVIITIASGGTLSPGDGGVGTLTLDNTASARSILNFSSGGLGAFDLGAGVTSDTVSLIGSASLASEVFFNNTTLNFTDLTGGSLSTGDYLLFAGDANVSTTTGYGGLTLGGGFSGTSFSGTLITGGLVVGSGLGGYSSSTLFLVGNDIYVNVSAVPEPSTCAALAGLGVLGLAAWRRRRG
jgi:autotransporter-associated beta strand protein